jgi:hypothetical protein
MSSFRIRIIKEWGPRGFKFFEETIWSSSLQKADGPKIKHFFATNNLNNVDVSLLNPPDDKTSRLRWNRHYEVSGQCVSMMHPVPIPAGSNHLKLTFCYASAEARQECRNQIIVVANALRLVFGVPVARELIFSSRFSEEEFETGISSDVGYASPFDTQSLNMFEDPPIEGAVLIPIPEDAAILLDKAFSQAFPNERFILMWLAFEAIIHSYPGRAENGKKREKFFKEELKSDMVNEEVFRLFRLRNDAFKEGRFSHPQFDQECWSLYAVLQLAIMKDCPQRSAFLSGYENTLKQRATPAE